MSKHMEHVIRVIIIVGGSFTCLGRRGHVGLVKNDLTACVDAAGELDVVDLDPEVVKLPIGQGQTMRSVCQDASPELKAYVNDHIGMSLEAGMTGRASIGYHAVRQFLKDPHNDSIFSQGFNDAIAKHNSSVRSTRIESLTGGSGGMGPGGGASVAETVADKAIASGSAVEHNTYRLGPAPFAGLRADNSLVDCAAASTLSDLYRYSPDCPKHDLLTGNIFLIQVPSCYGNKDLQDRYVATLMGAMLSEQVEAMRQTPASNSNSDLGHVKIIESDWHRFVPPELVARLAASEYKSQLELSRSRQTQNVELKASVSQHPSSGLPIAEILEHAMEGNLSQEDVVDLVEEPEVEHFVDAWLITDQQRINLRSLPERIGKGAATFSDLKRSFDFNLASLRELQKHIGLLQEEQRVMERSALKARKRLLRSIRRLCPSGILQSFIASLIPKRTKCRSFHRAASADRQEMAELSRLELELNLYLDTAGLLQRDLQSMQSMVDRIKNCLAAFIPGAKQSPKLCTFKHIDEVFQELRHMIPDDETANQRTLNLFVADCTLQGLAYTYGCEPRIDAIVRAVQAPDPELLIKSPWWGNHERLHRARSIAILPPVPEGLARGLKHEFSRVAPKQQVAFSDDARAGIVGIRLYIGTPVDVAKGGLAQVIPDMYQQAIERIRAQSFLYFPEGDAPLDWYDRMRRIASKAAKDGNGESPEMQTPTE